ncbi:MAG: hypothetical protein IT198_13210 [Acidimicrobiia bacterium]|nr:hypothetical protein [Acidimicrobiia bacterium]
MIRATTRFLRTSPVAAALLASILTASLVGGGMALAAEGGDVFNACARPSGRVRPHTIRVNVEPECHGGDTLVSWRDGGPVGQLAVVERTVHEVVGSGTGHHTIESPCEPGEVATGGGYTVGSIGDKDKVFASSATAGNTGWSVQFINDSGFDVDVWVSAECATIGEVA